MTEVAVASSMPRAPAHARLRLGVIACCAWLVALAPSPALAQPIFWGSIWYPAVPIPDTANEQLGVRVSSHLHPDLPRLRLDIWWANSTQPRAFPAPIKEAAAISVRLHTPDRTTASDEQATHWIGVSNAGSTTHSLIFTFPWQRNALDEAWFELRVAGKTYWIELPYGFARDPLAREPASEKRGRPVFPSTMANLGANDVVVPWLFVEYDVGVVPPLNWLVRLRLSNAFFHRALVMLSHLPEGGTAGTRIPWSIVNPQTGIELQLPGGRTVAGFADSVRLNDATTGREDGFRFRFDAAPVAVRDFGTVIVRADDQRFSIRVPFSLISFGHDAADAGTALTLPRPPAN